MPPSVMERGTDDEGSNGANVQCLGQFHELVIARIPAAHEERESGDRCASNAGGRRPIETAGKGLHQAIFL